MPSVALFGIPKFRIRTVSVVPDSAATGYGSLGRRLAAGNPFANETVNASAVAALAVARTRTTTMEINTVHP